MKKSLIMIAKIIGSIALVLVATLVSPLVGVAVIVFLISNARIKAKEKKEATKRQEQYDAMAKQRTEVAQQIIDLVDHYAANEEPSAAVTQTAWRRYNDLLKSLGIASRYPVFQVSVDAYNAVRNFGVDYVFAEKLLMFYYDVAYSYDLEPAEQDKLLFYLAYGFRYNGWDSGPAKDSIGDTSHSRQIFPENYFDWSAWDKRCVELLEAGCERQYLFAICLLARCYYNKFIVPLRDYDKAFALYQQAAQMGNLSAIYMLGQCYEKGLGTKKNLQKAGDCYQYGYNMGQTQNFVVALDELYTAGKWDKNRYSADIFVNSMGQMKKANLEKLKADVAKCEETDFDTADLKIVAISLRVILEEVVNSFVECYENASMKDGLSDKLQLLRKKEYFTKDISDKAHNVRRLGNRGAHNDAGETISADELRQAIGDIAEIVEYYAQY